MRNLITLTSQCYDSVKLRPTTEKILIDNGADVLCSCDASRATHLTT